MKRPSPSILILLCLAPLTASGNSPPECPPANGVALQVLGSGGPIADDKRASSAYLVWVGAKPRVMIDAGGGSFARFGEAGARFEDVSFVGLSHFHTDHSAEFPSFLKSAYFSEEKRQLTVAGPYGRKPFPALTQFLNSLFDRDGGAFGYLSGYLNGSTGLVPLDIQEVARDATGPVTVFEDAKAGLRVEAMHVPHGIVPALSFRVRVADVTIVFSSDQNGSDPAFRDFAKDADILIMHLVIPEGASGGATELHARPSTIGNIAAGANPKTLLLSHFMARSLLEIDKNVDLIRAQYDGNIVLAEDLYCLTATSQP